MVAVVQGRRQAGSDDPGRNHTDRAPQFAIVRLAWKGKGEPGKKGISAEVYTSVGEATPWRDVLSAETDVVPAFDMMRHEGSEWKKIHELSVGELRENGVVKEVLYLASYTRAYALYTITAEHPTSCISWTDAVPATQDEIDDFNEFLRGKDNKLLHVQGLYKIEITVRERTNFERSGNKEFHQLDLGPLDQRFTVAAVDAGHWPLTLTGRVLGEVTVLSGADGGRIDLGNAIAADQGRKQARDAFGRSARSGSKPCTRRYDAKLSSSQASTVEITARWPQTMAAQRHDPEGNLRLFASR